MGYVIIGKSKLKIKESKTGRVKYHKDCLLCSIKFIATRRTAKFCCNACKQAYYRNNNLYV